KKGEERDRRTAIVIRVVSVVSVELELVVVEVEVARVRPLAVGVPAYVFPLSSPLRVNCCNFAVFYSEGA
ncbi:MAG TPA: hypothetical protein VMQ44_01255, partial [Candidatus Saccharimonadales bacterium]|nr:hypothetical protein [Candidatus Saccharimonadales bacterium]